MEVRARNSNVMLGGPKNLGGAALGPNIKDVYTERGRGLPKCGRSKGGCVDCTMDLARMQTRGEGVQIPKIVLMSF